MGGGDRRSEFEDPWQGRVPGDAEGRGIPPPSKSSSAPTHLSETGVDSNEVGHGGTADDRGGRVMQAPPPGPQNPTPLPQTLPLPSPGPSPTVVQQVRRQRGDQYVLPAHGVQEGAGRVDARGQLGTGRGPWSQTWTPDSKNPFWDGGFPSFISHPPHLLPTSYWVKGENSDPSGIKWTPRIRSITVLGAGGART